MRLLASCALAFVTAAGAFAQVRGGFHSGSVPNSVGTNSGFGSVLFPAGRPTTGTPFTLDNRNFPRVLGNVVAGRPAFSGVPGARGRDFRRGGAVVVPYAYPVYMGGYYGPGYADENGADYGQGYGQGYGEAPQTPNVTVIYPPQQPVPIIINPGPPPAPEPPAHSMIREYGQPSAAPSDAGQTDAPYYLLAFKDHSVYSAIGYWVDGDTIHYLTAGNVHNQASLSLLDRELTQQLNKGRNMPIHLPPPSK